MPREESWSEPDECGWKPVYHTATLENIPEAGLLKQVVGALVDYSHVACRYPEYQQKVGLLASGSPKDALEFTQFINASGCTFEEFEQFKQRDLGEIAASVIGSHVKANQSSPKLADEIRLLSTMPWWKEATPYLSVLKQELLGAAMQQVSAHLVAGGEAAWDNKKLALVGLLDKQQIAAVSTVLSKVANYIQPLNLTDEYAPTNAPQLIAGAQEAAENEVKAIFEAALEGLLGKGFDTVRKRINQSGVGAGLAR